LAKAQQRLLVETAPLIRGYEAVLRYRPAYFATGDYYDFFDRTDGRTGVFIGDGSGHGPAACMLMATMRALLQTHPSLHQEPGATLAAAGAMFRELIPSDSFMTGLYVLLEEGSICWAAAGHHPPIRIRPDGTIPSSDLDQGGLPLGIHADGMVDYETVTWTVLPRERFLLFTDGLYEAQNRDGVKFGRAGLEECLKQSVDRPLGAMVDGILERVSTHLQGTDFEDDFTLIGLEKS
jgi:sigma-B regulation protein RsbU (phosphoserine phosphatase)